MFFFDLFTGDLKVFEGRFFVGMFFGVEKLSYAKAAPEGGARVDWA